MIKSRSEMNKELEIDLTGPEGNAFYLLGTASKLAKELDYTKDEQDNLIKDMQSSDYENLVAVFEKNFGSFVTLYR